MRAKAPKVTIYVVSHNYGKFLEEAVESVLRQSIDDWELLIFNDNSTDNTRQVMELYQGDARIRCCHTEGIGLPAICNQALAESRGKYLIRLDADDVFDENILLVLANHLDRNPGCAMVFPDYYYIDEDGEIFAHERREKIFDKNHMLDMPANGACCLIVKDVLAGEGGYREDLGAQDGYDLWNKLLGKHKVENVNIPLFYYRRHNKNLTNASEHILNAKRQIKKGMITEDLDAFRPINVVIPCRANYDFVPNLWNQKMGGKSLLQMNLEKCLSLGFADNIIVANDNPAAEEILKEFAHPKLRFFLRSREDTLRSRNLVSGMEKICQTFDPEFKGTTLISYPQAVFVKPETLEEALHTLVLNNCDSAFAVNEIKFPLFRRGAHGLVQINPPRGFTSDFDAVYKNANIVIVSCNRNFKTGSLTGASIVHFPVDESESLLIENKEMVEFARTILSLRNLQSWRPVGGTRLAQYRS